MDPDGDFQMEIGWRDRYFDSHETLGLRWYRVMTGSVLWQPTGEFMTLDPDPQEIPNVSVQTNWQSSPYNIWGEGEGSKRCRGHLVDWNIEGWPDPEGRDPTTNPMVGTQWATSRPTDWPGPPDFP